MKMIIIGITGTIGAGKGTIVEILKDKYGFRHFSVRDFITREIERRTMPVNRDTLVMVANELRAQNSPSYITDELFKMAAVTKANSIIESIRTPGEIASLRLKGRFFLFAVDADPVIRYKRIFNRGSATDHISFDTFVSNEQREFATTDPNKQNLQECIRQADYTFNNDSSIAGLEKQVMLAIDEILLNKEEE